MAFTVVSNGQVILAEHHKEITGALDGTSGYGQAVSMTNYNSAATYAVTIKNLDSTNAYGLKVTDEADNTLLAVAGAGVTVSEHFIITGGTRTNNDKLVNATVTWNDAADTFYGYFLNVTNTASGTNSKLLDLQVGGTSVCSVDTVGELVLNQGADDGAILDLMSSDVAHGITDVAATTVYGQVLKAVAADGGLEIKGLSDANIGIVMTAYCATAPDTTHTAAGTAAYIIDTRLKDGTGSTSIGANGNLFAVQNYGSTKFIIDAEGDLFNDGAALSAYDEHDDALAVWDMSYALLVDPEKQQQVTYYNQDRLAQMGIITLSPDGVPFVSNKKYNQLVRGAIGQLYQQVKTLEQKIKLLESKS